MKSGKAEQDSGKALRQEIKLYVNERLYKTGMIPEEVYEEAKIRIVAGESQRRKGKNGLLKAK